ncbi:MAG: HEAT repeat domain-containing protein, partial [Gemmatimonadota bacterium]
DDASAAVTSHPGTAAPSLIDLLETALDEEAWNDFSRGSAVRRTGRAGFARNVCVALGNWTSSEALPVLVRALDDPAPLVRGHAAWALGRIARRRTAAPAVRARIPEALEARLGVEEDAWTRGELEAALRDARGLPADC